MPRRRTYGTPQDDSTAAEQDIEVLSPADTKALNASLRQYRPQRRARRAAARYQPGTAAEARAALMSILDRLAAYWPDVRLEAATTDELVSRWRAANSGRTPDAECARLGSDHRRLTFHVLLGTSSLRVDR
jgi:hypothetical protein